MLAKFLLIALVCVSVAQVHGEELESAIQRGLTRAGSMNENSKARIDAAIASVGYKSQLVQVRTEEFVQRAVRVQDGSRQSLRKVASTMEQKAQEMNKPESVFRCIRQNEENANNQIETLTNKFKTDMERLKRVKLDNIKTDSRPLDGMQEALRVRYERAVKDIQNCRTASAVDVVVNSFGRWLDMTFANVARIQGQVLVVVNNFDRDANNYYRNSNNQITMIKSAALRAIKACLNTRQEIFGDF